MAVLKLPTAKIDFIDISQFEAAFLEKNYIMFSYLPIAIGKQNVSEKKNFDSGHWLLNLYRHLLLVFGSCAANSVIVKQDTQVKYCQIHKIQLTGKRIRTIKDNKVLK